MKKYFYCQSYQAFGMALVFNQTSETIVITSIPNIVKACEFLKIPYIRHQNFTINEMIWKKKDVENEINWLINIIGDDEFHFSHTQFAVFCFALATKLNMVNKNTFFHDFEVVYSKPDFIDLFNKYYIRTKIYQFIIKIILNLPIEVRKSVKNSFMISLKLDYMNNLKVISDKKDYFDLVTNMYKTIKFEYPELTNLFISQTFVNKNLFNIKKINELLPIINKESIYIKNHPKLGAVKGLEKCPTLPDYLPVEIFFNKIRVVVFSFHSASLIAASKFENIKKVISLLDIVGTNALFNKKVKKELIEKSNGRILFPKTIDEFEELIK